MGKIPDRWLPYRALGEIIKGTRFVAFKVPLSEKLSRGLPGTERFTPDILVTTCPKLSLVIDLTNTFRYYDKREFTSKSVHHEKICVPGKECPTSDLVYRFFEIVDQFMASEDNTDSLIGVHCTHGVNRTGYFICRYMIQRLGFDPMTALQAFQEGRGYPIERQNYVRDLKKYFRNQTECAEQGSVQANNLYRTAGRNNRLTNRHSSSKNANVRSSYRTTQINNSHFSVSKNKSNTVAESNNSCIVANTNTSWRNENKKRDEIQLSRQTYIGSNTNTSWRNENKNRDEIQLSRQSNLNNRNYQEGRKYEHPFPYNRKHIASGSNYNKEYSNVNSKLNSWRIKNCSNTSSHNSGTQRVKKPEYNYYAKYNSMDSDSHRDQSDDWRANNPYTQRNFGKSAIHTVVLDKSTV